MDRTIIVGYDGSDRSRDALALGELLARTTGARLLAAYVYLRPAAVEEGAELERLLVEEAERTLADAAAHARDGAPELVQVAGRSPAEGLYRLAEERAAATIVIGSSHHRAVGRVVAGSVPERLLHGAPCAVAIAPAGYAERPATPPREIGVGFDGSSEAQVALAAAADLAVACGARLHAITVVRAQPGLYVPGPFGAAQYASYVKAVRAQESRTLRAAVDRLGRLEIEVTTETLDGLPPQVLEERSSELDLLVLGSRSYGPLRRVLLGSVSIHLVRTAACPLLIVPRGAVKHGTDAPSSSNPVLEGSSR
ncbi:MAG TPA: universal stress protein [Conexibacter sp.]|nr:universal stress protein [Conexibacter sp.]